MTPSLHTLFHFGLFCTRNTYFVTQPRRGIPPLWPNTPRASDMKHDCCSKKKKRNHYEALQTASTPVLWPPLEFRARQMRTALRARRKNIYSFKCNEKERERGGGRGRDITAEVLRPISHQQIHRFSYCEHLSSFRRRLSERCEDRGGLFVSGLTCCVCSCVCVRGICVPKYCRFCGVGISNPMPAGRHVSMKGESTIAFSVCVCVLRFLPFFPQLQGFFLV